MTETESDACDLAADEATRLWDGDVYAPPLAELADTSDPRFTDDQRATLARFEAAPTPPEIVEARVVEEVARAIYNERNHCHVINLEAAPGLHAEYRGLAAAAVAAYRAAQDGGAEEAVLVEGDWIVPSREAHARDLTKSWADAAQNAGCPSAFVSRMRAFADVHDRNYRAALATQADR